MSTYFAFEVHTTGGKTYTNIAYANKQKYMNFTAPRLNTEVEAAGDGYDVTVTTDIFARGVFFSLEGIDNFFSDNYFDILPGGTRTVHVTTPLALNDFKKQLTITTLGHVYAHGETTINGDNMRSDANFKPLGGN